MYHNKGTPAAVLINIGEGNKSQQPSDSFIHATIPSSTQSIQANMIVVIPDEGVARENTTCEQFLNLSQARQPGISRLCAGHRWAPWS